jgi:hypothetical protein
MFILAIYLESTSIVWDILVNPNMADFGAGTTENTVVRFLVVGSAARVSFVSGVGRKFNIQWLHNYAHEVFQPLHTLFVICRGDLSLTLRHWAIKTEGFKD